MYSVIEFCGIDECTVAFDYYISQHTNDVTEFCKSVEIAVAKGFLHQWDFLVLDNALIHFYGKVEPLENWLWEEC
jgi:hypothetical protein